MGVDGDIEVLKAALLAMEERAILAEAAAAIAKSDAAIAQADAADAKAGASALTAQIADLKLEILRLKRDQHGQRSERGARLIDQLELQLEELEASATEDEVAAEKAAAKAGRESRPAAQRRHPVKKPFPAHLPRERVVVPAPTSCACCGSNRIAKLGEDVTETLEAIPRQLKVLQTVREKFTCRDCEKITQPPAPFQVIARGHVGPNLLAMVLYNKFALHQPLNRQSDEFAREGVDVSLSTLADHVGSGAFVLLPIYDLIERHVFAAERIHGDDTTVPLLAKGKTITARLWAYVRDDKPFGGADPPAAVYYFSRNRNGEHPQRHLAEYQGILQADAYGGYGKLYKPDRTPGPITEAACWAHGRRKFFVLADIAAKARDPQIVISPIALEAVRFIDAIFEVEREINGLSADDRRTVRQARVKPLVDALHTWMTEQRKLVSGKSKIGQALNYMLSRWDAFARFVDDGRICMSNNAAERAMRGVALGRRSWLFAGSDRGGSRAAIMYTLIQTAKLNGVDPQAWLADVLARIAGHPAQQLHELLPWTWKRLQANTSQAA